MQPHLPRGELRAQCGDPDLEDRLVSRLDHRLEPEGEVRRFEVIIGAIGRRRWSADDRAQILEETLVPGIHPARATVVSGLIS